MNAFVRWKKTCWCAEAARRFDLPWLIDDRVPLEVRFQLAAKRLHPSHPAQTPKVIAVRFTRKP
jgi:hypothetical protein